MKLTNRFAVFLAAVFMVLRCRHLQHGRGREEEGWRSYAPITASESAQ